MYHFTCYGPLLFLPSVFGWSLSPFLVFWMGFHAVLTPAASHSGYDDHFLADLGYYLHHRYCDCNYSGGTYRVTLAEVRGIQPHPPNPKSSLGFPSHTDYDLGVCALLVWAWLNYQHPCYPPWWIATAVTAGPAAWAVVLVLVYY